MVAMTTVIAVLVLLLLIYYYVDWWYFQWRMGLRACRAAIPVLGHLPYMVIYGPKSSDILLRGDQLIYPFKLGIHNVVIIQDPDLVQEILVKQFPAFSSRASRKVFPLINAPLDLHLLTVDGSQWHRIRGLANPAFTSRKLRGLHSFLIEITDGLVAKRFAPFADTKETITLKRVFQNYTMNVIGSISLGIDINSLSPAQEEEMIDFMADLVDLSGSSSVQSLVVNLVPKGMSLLKMLDFMDITAAQRNRLINIMKRSIKERRENPYHGDKKDLIQLLMDSKVSNISEDGQPGETQLTDAEVMSQLFIFLVAGIETTATSLTWCVWCMCKYRDMYRALEEEVLSVVPKSGPIDYDTISQLSYLEKWIQETVRIFPSVGRFMRMVEEPITVNNMWFKEGDMVVIPVDAIHMNPEFWENPTEFNPSRFDVKAKPGTYLPFGGGPRHCIGKRLALQQIKLLLATLLRDYDIQPGYDTPLDDPVQMKNDKNFLQNSQKPITCQVVRRNL